MRLEKLAIVDQIWLAQPGEPASSWGYFVGYRDAAYPDGIGGRLVARPTLEGYSRTTTTSGHSIRAFSSRFQWASRCVAYDIWVDRQRQTIGLDRMVAAQERHLAAVAELGEIAALERAKLLEQSRDPDAPALSAQTVVKMLETWVQLDRLILGESTARVEVQAKIDLDLWSVEDLRAQAELLRRNGALT
jgi:hypothetical protein